MISGFRNFTLIADRPSSFRRSGFTLLELVLALSMSVVLMVLIGQALQFYMRDMNVRDMDIRQTQLAASIVQMIEDDLRSTLHTNPADTAPLEALFSSIGGGESDQGANASDEDLSAAGIDSSIDPLDLGDDFLSEVDLSSGVSVLTTPGLIGNQGQIQIDVSRLPRLEEYVALLDQNTNDIDDIPSDIKTIAYFVQMPEMIGGVQDDLSNATLEMGLEMGDNSSTGGLVRRSLDRAATVEAANTGSLTLLNQTGDVIAPEVTSILFSYWDGVTWQPEWSSDAFEELPLAIQVQVTIAPEGGAAAADAGFSNALSTESMRTFSHIIRLPLARPIEETAEEDLTEAGI